MEDGVVCWVAVSLRSGGVRRGGKLSSPLSWLPSLARSPSDLSHQLALSKPDLTITTPTLLPALLEAYSLHPSPPTEDEIKRTTIVASPTNEHGYTTLDEFVAASQGVSSSDVAEIQIDCEDTAVICFSSGTEGLSKGVE